MRAEDQVHHRVGHFDLLGHVRLLHHAAADGDDLPGPRLLRVVERAHVAQHAHLRVLAHGAGVDDDDIRLKLVLCEAVAHFGEVSADLLTVGLVLLAAVGVHHGKGPLPVRGHALKNLRTDSALGFDFLYIDDFSLNRHGGILLVFSIRLGNYSVLAVFNGENIRSVSLRTSDRCHWCGNPHLFIAVLLFRLYKGETDSHASVATLARNDRGGMNSYNRSKIYPFVKKMGLRYGQNNAILCHRETVLRTL